MCYCWFYLDVSEEAATQTAEICRRRAYTFHFCCFLSVAYTTLNILFAVFYIYYICGFTKEAIATYVHL